VRKMTKVTYICRSPPKKSTYFIILFYYYLFSPLSLSRFWAFRNKEISKTREKKIKNMSGLITKNVDFVSSVFFAPSVILLGFCYKGSSKTRQKKRESFFRSFCFAAAKKVASSYLLTSLFCCFFPTTAAEFRTAHCILQLDGLRAVGTVSCVRSAEPPFWFVFSTSLSVPTYVALEQVYISADRTRYTIHKLGHACPLHIPLPALLAAGISCRTRRGMAL
jgi:hypothetical protein